MMCRGINFMKRPCAWTSPLPTAPAGAIPSLRACWRPCSRVKTWQTAVQWGAAHGILVQETPGDITMIEEKIVLAEVKRAMGKGGVKAVR